MLPSRWSDGWAYTAFTLVLVLVSMVLLLGYALVERTLQEERGRRHLDVAEDVKVSSNSPRFEPEADTRASEPPLLAVVRVVGGSREQFGWVDELGDRMI